jgi:hypothetical protein
MAMAEHLVVIQVAANKLPISCQVASGQTMGHSYAARTSEVNDSILLQYAGGGRFWPGMGVGDPRQ